MSFEIINGVCHFSEYKSFFKFINNYEGNLTIRKSNVFDTDKLIAVFNHKEKVSEK